jgi:glyoxylase-like metal-dependent hydrolase (beta-lactamase superfamily II)
MKLAGSGPGAGLLNTSPGPGRHEEIMDWKLQVIPVGPLQMNAVVLTGVHAGGTETILIDPGEEPARLLAAVEATGGELKYLLATHGHFDHISAAAAVQDVHDLPLRCHRDDLPLIREMPAIQGGYGFPPSRIPRCETDLEDGMTLPFAGGQIEVTHVPGHSPGQVMFALPPLPEGAGPGCAIVGDCLFAGSIGRTDLPGGDFATLEKSIRERIYSLPDDTVVVSGHGPDTTVGREKASNPFVRA